MGCIAPHISAASVGHGEPRPPSPEKVISVLMMVTTGTRRRRKPAGLIQTRRGPNSIHQDGTQKPQTVRKELAIGAEVQNSTTVNTRVLHATKMFMEDILQSASACRESGKYLTTYRGGHISRWIPMPQCASAQEATTLRDCLRCNTGHPLPTSSNCPYGPWASTKIMQGQ